MMDTIERHWKLLLIEGILFVILGMMAVALPAIFTLSIELFLGWLLIFGGIFQAFRSIQARGFSGSYPSLIASMIAILIGVLLIVYPLTGVLTLTILLATYFLIEGIAKIVIATQWKPSTNWGWLLVSGILSLLISLIIWGGFPGTAAWALGLLVGINMIFFGWSLIAMSLFRGDTESPLRPNDTNKVE